MSNFFLIIPQTLPFLNAKELTRLRLVCKHINEAVVKSKSIKKLLWNAALLLPQRKLFWTCQLNLPQYSLHRLKLSYFHKFPLLNPDSFFLSILSELQKFSQSSQDDRQKSCKNDILKDIPRTYLVLGNPIEESNLLNVLLAFSYVKPNIGYCQGLNFLAAVLIKVTQDAETAFWLLLGLIDKWDMENMYVPGVPDLSLREFQLNHYFHSILPDLYAHFRKLGVTNAFFISRWFMTLFSTYLPLECLLPIWDCFFVEGWKVMIKVSIHLLKQSRQTLLQWDLEEISKHLRKHILETDATEILVNSRAVRVTRKELERLENEFYRKQVNFKLVASEINHVLSEDDLRVIRWGKEELENFNETTQQDVMVFQSKINRLDCELENFSKHYLQITMEYSQVSHELESLLEKKEFYTKMLKEMQEKYRKKIFPRFFRKLIKRRRGSVSESGGEEKIITREDIEACEEKLRVLELEEHELKTQCSEKKQIYKDALSKAYDLNDRKKKYSSQLCDFLNLIKQ